MKWYEQGAIDGGVIISSRVRLARNLSDHPFPSLLNAGGATKLMGEIADALSLSQSAAFRFTDLANLSPDKLLALLERHVISPEMLRKKGPRGLLSTNDEGVCVMVNEEDHVRIQAFKAGADLDGAFETADRIDDLIEESVVYAFDAEFGYLTGCPTNTGTGMRAGFMLHLPALERTNRLKGIVEASQKLGIAFRGIHGEGSESIGSIYQVSNQMTLGKPERETVAALKNVTGQIMEHEQRAKTALLGDARTIVEDHVWRAYAILRHCRTLKANEALSLLSDVRAGYLWGLLDEAPRPKMTIYNIMVQCQRGGMAEIVGLQADESHADAARAAFVREQFAD